MSIQGLLLRFTGIYVALLVFVGVGFAALGIKANSGVNAGALIGAVFGACLWFGTKNKRYLERTEKNHAALGMWVIDLVLQLIVVWLVGAATGAKLPLGPMLLGLAFVALLHGVAIYFTVGMAGKQFARQTARGI
jgi:hypothetical protein